MKTITKTALSAALLSSLLPWAAARAQTPPASAPATQPMSLYVVGYAHLDTQWRWTYKTTIDQFLANTLKDNFARFEKYPHYTFNFTGAHRYQLMKEYFPEDYETMKKFIAAGRWFPGGSAWEEIDVNSPSSESILRQALYANEFFQHEFKTQSNEMMLPDTFGFPASIPTILHHAGLKGFSTQKLNLNWGPAIPPPFFIGIWNGPDGSGIISALQPGSYTGTLTTDLSKDPKWIDRITLIGEKSGIFMDYHYYGVGDRGGAPQEASLRALEKSITSDGPIKVMSSRSRDMFDALTPAQISKLPTYAGDLLLTEHSCGSLTSQAAEKRWNRKAELLADNAERSAVTAAFLGGAAYPREKITDAWHLLLGEQFHDTMAGTALPEAYQFAWNNLILSQNQSAAVVENSVASIARALDTHDAAQPLIIYNPLSIPREDLVEAAISLPESEKQVHVVAPDGTSIPAQINARQGNLATIAFIAKVPSVGYAVYDVRPGIAPGTSRLAVTSTTLSNQRYSVTLNEHGDVASIIELASKREVLSAPTRIAFERSTPSPYPAWNMKWADRQQPPYAYLDGPAAIRITENGPARVALEVTRSAQGSTFIQNIRLSDTDGPLEFATTLHWNTRATTLKAEIPLAAANPLATYNCDAGTIQRGNNTEKKFEVPSHQWFDLTAPDNSAGASVLEDCKYGSDKPDDHLLRLTLLYTPAVGKQYKDQATQDLGTQHFTYAILGHEGDWRAAHTSWHAARLNQPLTAFTAGIHNGTLGKSFSMAATNSPQVAIRALKQAEESDEIIVRIEEMQGKPAPGIQIQFAANVLSAREVDGQEHPLGIATIANGRVTCDLTPYQFRAFAVKLAPPQASVEVPKSFPIKLPFNENVITARGENSAAGFDAAGRALPADMLPTHLVLEDIPFDLAPVGGLNALSCKGQVIPLPTGNLKRLYLLCAAADGDATCTFKLGDAPQQATIQDWGARIGSWDTRQWAKPFAPIDYTADIEMTGIKPGLIKRAEVAWYSSHRHDPAGKLLTFEFAYLFKVPLDIPAGAKTLTLPDNPRVKILALTAAETANELSQPAAPLYDTLNPHQ